jgi:3-oxoacyl-[acyl-carrier protein] reductase
VLSLSLEGRTALVFGGSGGIGGAASGLLAHHGASVWIADLDSRPELPGRFLRCDVRERDSVEGAVAAAAAAGDLDIVVYATGVTRDAVLWKLSDDDWDEVLDVNLRGAFYALRAVAPRLRARGRGAIVLVTSINGERGKFGQSNYAASKAGLIGLTKTAARELGRFGVRVNAVAPGLTATAMTRVLPKAVVDAAVAETALGRAATPDDVASAILFLSSDLAGHVTGQTLRVDGGQYL